MSLGEKGMHDVRLHDSSVIHSSTRFSRAELVMILVIFLRYFIIMCVSVLNERTSASNIGK